MPPYTVYLEAKVSDDEIGEDLATLSRLYEAQSLDKLQDIATHFGKSAGLLVEGIGLGLDPDAA